MMTSRTRVAEYVKAFGLIDETRIILLSEIVEKTIDNINKQETEEIEELIDVLMDKVDFLDQVSEHIMTGFMENDALNGN